MAYVDGQSLREKTESGPLKLESALGLAVDIANGLHEAHEKEIVHRDIKSANIMVTKKGHAKITDFGLAKLAGRTQVTKAGTTVGTVAYMSPEQARGEAVDHRSDIWSMGVVLYEMLTGQFPFRGDHEQAVTYQVVHEDATPITTVRSGVPIEFERIVNKCMEKDPSNRYQHVDEVLVDLRKVKKAPAPKPKKKLIKYALPGSVFFLAVILFLIFKPFTFEISPDQKAVAAENSLAIMYFKNLADRDDLELGEIVTSLLITGLSESEYMTVVSSQRLYDILKLQGKEGAKVLDEATSTEVATHAGAKWMLTGNILQLDPNFVINSQLADVRSGSIVASQRVEGEPGETIFTVVDKLAAEAKRDLSLPEQAHKEPETHVADITTHSIEAYRYYIEGMEHLHKWYVKEAKASFEKALAYDSTFAMAYSRLLDPFVPGTEAEKIPWREKAILYSERTSKKERLYIKAESAHFSLDDTEAIKGYETIIDLYPDEKRAYYKLGRLYRLKDPKKAIENYRKAIELDPLDKAAYNSLAYQYDRLGDFEKSIWAINQYIALAPDEANPYDTRGDLYAYNGKIGEAIDSYNKAHERKPDFSLRKLGRMYLFKQDYAQAETFYRKLMESTDEAQRGWARFCLALIPLYQGKWDRALEVLNQGISADELEGHQGWGYWNKLSSKAKIYAQEKDLVRALAIVERLVQSYEKAYPENPVIWGDDYVYLLVKKGDLSRATEVANALNRHTGDDSWQYWWRKGCIEQGRGNMDAACTSFEKAVEFYGPHFRMHYELALAYLKAGRLADAVDEFERLLERFDQSRAIHPGRAVKAYYHLGVAYEQSGWNDKAIEQYEEFLDIWKDADPGTEELEDAKRRLAALKGKIQ
jgi:tetratricopeptide (TPR) repeat protein